MLSLLILGTSFAGVGRIVDDILEVKRASREGRLPHLSSATHSVAAANGATHLTFSMKKLRVHSREKLILQVTHSYPEVMHSYRYSWLQMEAQIEARLTENGINTFRKTFREVVIKEAKHKSSQRLFDLTALSDKKVKTLLRILEDPSSSSLGF